MAKESTRVLQIMPGGEGFCVLEVLDAEKKQLRMTDVLGWALVEYDAGDGIIEQCVEPFYQGLGDPSIIEIGVTHYTRQHLMKREDLSAIVKRGKALAESEPLWEYLEQLGAT